MDRSISTLRTPRPLAPNIPNQDHVTGRSIADAFGWTFLRALAKHGSFWIDSEGRLFWWHQDFERDSAIVRREGGQS
jgi:hypothetical protein